MGTFLAMTSVVGKTKDMVVNSLRAYAQSVKGGLEIPVFPGKTFESCVIYEANGNTSIAYPSEYLEWDDSSQFISRDLGAAVFSFHIHDGDLWMYLLYVNGEVVDQFNPIPDYWDDGISMAECQSWQGSASTVARYLGTVTEADIKNYLIRWDLDAEETQRAYPDDEYVQEDWQLLDFMRKLRLPNPINDDGTAKGEIYKLWTMKSP